MDRNTNCELQFILIRKNAKLFLTVDNTKENNSSPNHYSEAEIHSHTMST